jgi:hypothetical protein
MFDSIHNLQLLLDLLYSDNVLSSGQLNSFAKLIELNSSKVIYAYETPSRSQVPKQKETVNIEFVLVGYKLKFGPFY